MISQQKTEIKREDTRENSFFLTAKYYVFETGHAMHKNLNTAAYCSILILSLLLFYAKFQPLSFHPTNAGLDPSWQASLAFSLENGRRFGTDVVFTGGPLSSIYTRQYVGGYTYPVALFSILIALYLAASTARILSLSGSVFAALSSITLIYVCYTYPDTLLLIVPMLTAIAFLENQGKSVTAHATVGSFICGILVLAKFSIFPLSVVTVLVLDVLTVRRRAIPVQTLALAVGIWIGLIASGQSISELPAFLLSSFDVSSGYSAAMSLPAHVMEVTAWLVLAALFIIFLVWQLYVGRRSKEFTTGIAKIFIILAFLFIAWKAGFVRHDLHSLIAWGSLSMAIIFTGIAGANCFSASWWCALALAIISIIPSYQLLYHTTGRLPFVTGLETTRIIMREIGNSVSLIAHPAEWQAKLEERNRASLAEIQTKLSLPALNGTVDIIQSEQSDLLANSLQYTPRPTIQEYTTYSPKLINRNRAFFEGSRAPGYLIMAPGSIDGRHPASAEGALWPLFFASYATEMDLGRNLVLKKRASPLQNLLTVWNEVDANIGEQIPVPDHDGPIMLSVRMHPTIFGRLLDIIYRPPLTELLVTYVDGKESRYRLIPAMATEGFIVSPLISTTSDYAMASTGFSREAGLRYAKSIRVNVNSPLWLGYHQKIEVGFAPLNNDALKQADPGPIVSRKLKAIENLKLLVANNPLNGVTLAAVPEGLLAHAPMTLKIPVVSGSKLDLAFGMRKGTWQDGGETDGVCFVAAAESSVLMRQCLDPVKKAADREQQTSVILIPPDVKEIELRTECGKNCAWDWSYWSSAVVEEGK